MNTDFPDELAQVAFTENRIDKPENLPLSRSHLEVGENDFYLDMRDIARYYVRRNKNVIVQPYENADMKSVNLFLNGSVLGAVLHQKGMLPLHGSSLEYKGKGILICGHSGAGKSSVTMAFCQQGGKLINDDISPVEISESGIFIYPLRNRIKLWDDSLKRLNIPKANLERIRPGLEKFYLPVPDVFASKKELHYLFILCTHNKDSFEVSDCTGMNKYNTLRRQIYRKVYLKGMPETEKNYFRQLLLLAGKVKVMQIVRPQVCGIHETMRTIEAKINNKTSSGNNSKAATG